MKLRLMEQRDLPELYALYLAQVRGLNMHPKVRRSQFDAELFTCRMSRDPAVHHAEARVAWVAERSGKVVAFVSGGMQIKGDGVVGDRTGFIQAVIAAPGARKEITALTRKVVAHIRRFRPAEFVAFEGCLCPTFFGDAACCLPSAWAWIGLCLLDAGFSVNGSLVRMARDLTSSPRPKEPRLPNGLKFYHCGHGMMGFSEPYDFGCVLLRAPYGEKDSVVWCGNFYGGCFVKGAGYRSLYLNWFTTMGEENTRRGFGRLTLQHVLCEAAKQGAQSARLITDADNLIAQHLYRSEGFDVVDVMQRFILKRA